jgi:hypothetical protein
MLGKSQTLFTVKSLTTHRWVSSAPSAGPSPPLNYLRKHQLGMVSGLQDIGVLNAGHRMRLGSVGHATPHNGLEARTQASQSQGPIRRGKPVLKSAEFCCVTESYHNCRNAGLS